MLNPLACSVPLEPSAAIVRNPLVVTPETIVMNAVFQMHSGTQPQLHGTESVDTSPPSCILVVEDDRPIGISTKSDLVRLIAERRDLDKLVMREVMTPDPIALQI